MTPKARKKPRRAGSTRSRLHAGLLGLACLPAVHAADLRVAARADGKPLGDVVFSLHAATTAANARPGEGVIDQRDAQFVPRVSVVTPGSPVRFPNSDNVRHQVYSFSPAKRFELPLYSGQAAPPVVFDTPGVVVLGCNIHDWMVAYVVVVDTPYHAQADAAGTARLSAPAGTYTLRAWHPDLAGGEPLQVPVTLGAAPVERVVELTIVPRGQAAPAADAKLRALQEKLRKLKERR